MTDVLIIDLNPRWAECWLCGTETPCRWGLPVFNADLVSNDFTGEWGGVPACRECHDAHAAGQLETFDHCYLPVPPRPFVWTLEEWKRQRFLAHRALCHLIVRE